jgi:GNAT superfamily N-acetyltransferase
MAGAWIYGFFFNKNHRTGHELFWWVEPEQRGHGLKLLKALEEWARDRGAQSFQMGGMRALKNLDNIYKRVGYEPSESIYRKKLA